MKKIYYNIAVGLTILNLAEIAIRKFTDFGFILPKTLKLVSVTVALLFFGIHYYNTIQNEIK